MSDFKIKRKDWESEFFNLEVYELLDWKTLDGIDRKLATINFDLLECNLDFERFDNLAKLEELGFRTIDSRISFLTLIDTEDSKFLSDAPEYIIRPFIQSDFNAVLELTHTHLTHNDSFISRYKNEAFFPKGSALDYFSTWIEFSINSPNSITVVSEWNEQVVGFFIIEKKNLIAGIPVWKGRLTAVEKNHRGKKLHLSMQTKIFEIIGLQQFYLDNTTQLSNLAVIKNHIKSNRRLESMSLNLMLANV